MLDIRWAHAVILFLLIISRPSVVSTFALGHVVQHLHIPVKVLATGVEGEPLNLEVSSHVVSHISSSSESFVA